MSSNREKILCVGKCFVVVYPCGKTILFMFRCLYLHAASKMSVLVFPNLKIHSMVCLNGKACEIFHVFLIDFAWWESGKIIWENCSRVLDNFTERVFFLLKLYDHHWLSIVVDKADTKMFKRVWEREKERAECFGENITSSYAFKLDVYAASR